MDPKHEFIVQSYNTKELAERYGISPKIMRKWLARLKPALGTRIGNYYSASQVQIIVDHLGRPEG
jgi:uncharacterized protein YjcR